jgi:signal transduction histidine kinase
MYWRTAPGSLVAMQLLTRLRFADDLEPGFAGYHTGRTMPVARFGLVLTTLLRTLAGCAARACLAVRAAGYSIGRGLRTGLRQRRLLEAQRAELATHNAQLGSALAASVGQLRRQAAELQASRTRIVTAADCERRRIERNLHDGAQQRLTALAIKLSLACELAESHDDQVREVLAELRADVREAADELRCLAHGIYPPVLVESGLPAALSMVARRSTLPITVHAALLGRYPAETEAAIYFCCLEAIQNAGKHAGDRARLEVRVWADGAALAFEVSDDGQGFQAGRCGHGAGFVNMQDRLCALGGRLRVESAPGQGTRVAGSVPDGRDAPRTDVAGPR